MAILSYSLTHFTTVDESIGAAVTDDFSRSRRLETPVEDASQRLRRSVATRLVDALQSPVGVLAVQGTDSRVGRCRYARRIDAEGRPGGRF